MEGGEGWEGMGDPLRSVGLLGGGGGGGKRGNGRDIDDHTYLLKLLVILSLHECPQSDKQACS